MLLRHRQRESSQTLKPFGEVRQPVEDLCIQLERLDTMNPLSAEPCCQLLRILVRVHSDPSSRLARTMEARRFRSSDVNPHLQCTRQVPYGDRRLIRLGYPVRERDALRVLETISQHPRQHALRRFGRMPGYAQAQ